MRVVNNGERRLSWQQSQPPHDPLPISPDVGDLALEKAKSALRKPLMYKVVMLNDDYTPMDFVVEVLERYFSKNREQAVRIMMTVHKQGRAVCGVFSRDVAETKAEQVIDYARECQHPLLCQVEEA